MWMNSSTWAIFCCISSHISRKLVQKCSNQDLNQCPFGMPVLQVEDEPIEPPHQPHFKLSLQKDEPDVSVGYGFIIFYCVLSLMSVVLCKLFNVPLWLQMMDKVERCIIAGLGALFTDSWVIRTTWALLWLMSSHWWTPGIQGSPICRHPCIAQIFWDFPVIEETKIWKLSIFECSLAEWWSAWSLESDYLGSTTYNLRGFISVFSSGKQEYKFCLHYGGVMGVK